MTTDPERRMRALRSMRWFLDEAALARHAAGDWLFVAGVLAAIAAVAVVPLIVAYGLATALRHAF